MKESFKNLFTGRKQKVKRSTSSPGLASLDDEYATPGGPHTGSLNGAVPTKDAIHSRGHDRDGPLNTSIPVAGHASTMPNAIKFISGTTQPNTYADTQITPFNSTEYYVDTRTNTNSQAANIVAFDVPALMNQNYPMPDRMPASRKSSMGSAMSEASGLAFDDAPNVVRSYDAIPLLEQIKLPRGGISMETQAVGRVQFGIPPETIKDSMRLGLSVPAVYIVPVERFCREMGPALGVNLAEFEFPAYFNFFVYKKRCTLVVDSEDAERNIRLVFSETLLGPAQFRRGSGSIEYQEEDFAPDFPRDMIPNFAKELKHFRIMPDGKELVLETLLNFRHFEFPGENSAHEKLGIPPPLEEEYPDRELPDTQDPAQLGEVEVGESKDELEGLDAQEHLVRAKWTYSQARWIGDVSTVWPSDASEDDIKNRKCRRVEIFKMPGGTEYILHDIDENNHIVGKARFSGNVKVSESMSVDGFGGKSILDQHVAEQEQDESEQEFDMEYDSDNSEVLDRFLANEILPPTFHPPSFGVTVLGNSHGFDKVGSTSGYVLWINGRGVMIDPPPYSSATLEREGIRPRTIVGIILTHCHADHDAGAFQKVLTGSPVVVITTPTIYKSFIRKYAALSALSPALLRHSHRHKPAIIGKPLRFQGATFHFTYTLHTIPCVGFKVEWRGRSMVFTGDHFNSPPAIDKLQESGVLSKARADDLRNLPLQEADLLLHEAGAPPIHTPLDVLLALPERVKKRLYVVHTSALPEGCELRVAPTGTAGTIRLDKLEKGRTQIERSFTSANQRSELCAPPNCLESDGAFSVPWSYSSNEYGAVSDDAADNQPSLMSSFSDLSPNSNKPNTSRSNSLFGQESHAPPLVSLRPASSTDAWFILNLLSAVPFLSSLSYASTMEVLETARVDAYCKDEVIVSSARRNAVLCVVWEGTCVERAKNMLKSNSGGGRISAQLHAMRDIESKRSKGAVWYAGDWTGPIALQPDKRLSGDSALVNTHDVVAMSSEGAKVITVEFSNLHAILKTGSALYRKYLDRRNKKKLIRNTPLIDTTTLITTQELLADALRNLNVLELLDCNSALRKLSAVQKRHLESLAEGPISFQAGERLWRAGAPVDNAYIVVSGTASFVPRRRNAGSVGLPQGSTKATINNSKSPQRPNECSINLVGNAEEVQKFASLTLGESMRLDAITAIRELGKTPTSDTKEVEKFAMPTEETMQLDSIFARPVGYQEGGASALTDTHDYVKLSRGLQKRADLLRCQSEGSNSPEFLMGDVHDYDLADDDSDSLHNFENVFGDLDEAGRTTDSKERRLSMARRRSSRARFANKVLGRLYNRRAFNGGLVFSRGHFLGDVSKMVAGLLSRDVESADTIGLPYLEGNSSVLEFGFGERVESGLECSPSTRRESLSEMIIHEQEGDEFVVHSSTLTAGKEGCIVLVIPKASLIPFLDEYPGLLLSLLNTQVVI